MEFQLIAEDLDIVVGGQDMTVHVYVTEEGKLVIHPHKRKGDLAREFAVLTQDGGELALAFDEDDEDEEN